MTFDLNRPMLEQDLLPFQLFDFWAGLDKQDARYQEQRDDRGRLTIEQFKAKWAANLKLKAPKAGKTSTLEERLTKELTLIARAFLKDFELNQDSIGKRLSEPLAKAARIKCGGGVMDGTQDVDLYFRLILKEPYLSISIGAKRARGAIKTTYYIHHKTSRSDQAPEQDCRDLGDAKAQFWELATDYRKQGLL